MLQQIACQEPLPSSDGKPIDSFGQQNDAFQSHQETPPNHRKLGNMAGPVRVGQVGLHSMLSHHHRIRGHQQPWVGARGSHPNSELNNNAGAVSDHRVNDQGNDEISLFALSAENEKGESDNVDTPKSDLPPSKVRKSQNFRDKMVEMDPYVDIIFQGQRKRTRCVRGGGTDCVFTEKLRNVLKFTYQSEVPTAGVSKAG
eukprot:193018_1